MGFAFIFESVGGTEWFVLLGVVLIVVGPKNLPAAARKLGQIMTNLRRAADEFKRQLMSMDQEVRKEVDSAIADTPAPSDSTADQPDDPYPGHDDYYDETSYENYYGSEDPPDGDTGDGTGGDEATSAESPSGVAASAPEQPPPPTDEELRRVTITVSKAPGKSA